MKNSYLGSSIVQKMVLLLCGTLISGIAVTILTVPDAPDLSYAIALGRDRQLTSALRASAIGLLLAGLVVLAGAFRRRWAGAAMTTAAAVFLALGVSQSLALVMGGIDEEEVLVAAIAEFAIGAISLINLNTHRKQFQIQ
ncbi:MAG: DUF4345 family protein [Woeseiaceae bacterium]|nr:DUF4345 family protein [Woeseiaceae bacterium]